MDKEHNIYLINKKISSNLVTSPEEKTYYIDFKNYIEIEQLLRKKEPTIINIYDQTHIQDEVGKIISVNDHINRIGDNPFIGKQKQFDIDFINIEKLYTQDAHGVTTNSCGHHAAQGQYPSTHLANIAIMAHVFKFTVKAFLVNT